MTRRDELPSLMTVSQVCAFLNIARSTLYALEQRGALPTTRVPFAGGVRFDGDQLRRFGTTADIRARVLRAVR